MKELLLVCTTIGAFVLGFFAVNGICNFSENNSRQVDVKNAKNSILIAFDNPMIIDSLMPTFEKLSKENPDCELCFLLGNSEDIFDRLKNNLIDIGFTGNADVNDAESLNLLCFSAAQTGVYCEKTGCLAEPLEPSAKTFVIWKKTSGKTLIDSFANSFLKDK